MAKVVLVGEAWGAREALFEHAFVGYSGAELARMLHQAALAPAPLDERPSELEMIRYWRGLRETHDIAVANVFNARPADNNIELFFTTAKEGATDLPPLKRGKYLKPEHVHHLEALWALIEREKPNLVVAFGNTACWALLGEAKISALRGTIQSSKRLGVKVLPTYHPAAILRQWNLRPIVLTDLEKASREANFSEVKRTTRWLTISPTLEEIAEWLRRPASYYAVDIENHPAFITMISFARAHDDALVIPFFDETLGNYWPTPEAEAQAWRYVHQGLTASVPKIFQNGVYDLSHLLRMGFRPTMCYEDTMLIHHALYPEMLKGLGFLGSVYTDELAWKTMRGKGNNLKRDE